MAPIKDFTVKPIISPPGASQPFGVRAKELVHGQNRFLSPNTVHGAANVQVAGGPPAIQAQQAGLTVTASAVAKPKAMPHNPLQGKLAKGASKMTKQQLKIAGLIKLARCKGKLMKMRGKTGMDKQAGIGDAAQQVGKTVSPAIARALEFVGAKETGAALRNGSDKMMRGVGYGTAGAGATGTGLAIGLPFTGKKKRKAKKEEAKEACLRGVIDGMRPTEAELNKFASTLPSGTNVKRAYVEKVAILGSISPFIKPILAALGIGIAAPHAISGLNTLAGKLFDPYTYTPHKPVDYSRWGGLNPSDENTFRRGVMQRAALESQTNGLLNSYSRATRPEYYS